MSSEMVERVAQAVRENIEAALPDGIAVDWGYAARAAIEAMKHPNTAMRHAFWDAEDPTDTGFRNAWDAAIDAALKE